MTIQIWRHSTGGEDFAVEVEGDRVVAACGPLHYTEVEKALAEGIIDFDNDEELAEVLEEHGEEYNLVASFK